MWATASEELSSGTSGILITVEPDKSTVDSVENMMAKPNARLSPELLKRLKDASGKFLIFSLCQEIVTID